MAQGSQPEPVDTRAFPTSLRITFEFDEDDVRVAREQEVRMIAPPSPGRPPKEGDVGAWLDLLDEGNAVRFFRRIHDPFNLIAEHHSPDGSHEVVIRPRGKGFFQVLVPSIPETRFGRLFASELGDSGTLIPAKPILEFELRREVAS